MKNFLIFSVLVTGLICCQNAPKADSNALSAGGNNDLINTGAVDSPIVQLRGILMVSNGKMGLMDYPKQKLYFVVDLTKSIDTLYTKAVQPCAYVSETVYAVLTGRFNGLGEMKLPKFEVTRVDTISGKSPELMDRAGFPYEFWCHGTEPFWSVEIANMEGGIFYENQGDGAAWFCPWIAPVKQGKSWVYTLPPSPGSSDALSIKITKEKANDGMSEQVYEYSCEVKARGVTYKGVAVRGTSKILGPAGDE